MSDQSAKLALPYMQASQAQKHVTHNEALRRLDSVVQLGAISKDISTPPGLAADGDAYIVAGGATGAWAGQEGKLAVWDDTAWVFYAPNEGWTAWVGDLDTLWSYDGAAWVETAPRESWQNQPMLGLNTTADTTNRLSVAAPATLLSHEGAGHQLKINKAADTDTASLLFQSNWTGHAEMGLAGNTDFSIKVSDGTSWFTALQCASSSGRVAFPAGVSGKIEQFDTGGSVFLGEGAGALDDLSNNQNVFIGGNAGGANVSGSTSVAIGAGALRNGTASVASVAIGSGAAYNLDGSSSVFIGANSGRNTSSASNNTAVGHSALFSNTVNNGNTAIGRTAAYFTDAPNNTALGYNALYANQSGTTNSALGVIALRYTTTGADNTAYNNCTGVGYDTRVSGSNQVQLGNSNTTTYAYGAVQDRSDARDKTDVRDTALGLDFITRLRPVDFRWDMRDDYFDEVEEVDPETGETVTKLVAVTKDGSRKRGRFHHGFIAQEVAEVLKETGLDFGGYQDHNYSGHGEDVLSLGYTEFIAPLIRAVQELAAEVAALKAS